MADKTDHMSQGHELLRSGKYEEALASFEQVTCSPSELYRAGLGKVAAYRGLGDLEKAWHRWVDTSSLTRPCNVPGAAWVYHTMARFHLDRASGGDAWKGDEWEALKCSAIVLVLSGDRPEYRWRTAEQACRAVDLVQTSELMSVMAEQASRADDRFFNDGTHRAAKEIEARIAANHDAHPAESLRFAQALVMFIGHRWVGAATALRKLAAGNEEARSIVSSTWREAMWHGDDLWMEGRRTDAVGHWEASRELFTGYGVLVRQSYAAHFQGRTEQARELAGKAIAELVDRTGYWNWIALVCKNLSLEEWAEYRPVLQALVGHPYVDRCGGTLEESLARVEEYIGDRLAR